jgi:hypothetical protein
LDPPGAREGAVRAGSRRPSGVRQRSAQDEIATVRDTGDAFS